MPGIPKDFILESRTSFLTPATLSARFNALGARDKGVAALSAKFTTDGFKPLPAATAFHGFKQEFVSQDKLKITFGLEVRGYSHADGSRAAIGVATMTDGKNSETYRFGLVTPSGKPDKLTEYTVTVASTVVLAHSWMSRLKACIRGGNCAKNCKDALAGCLSEGDPIRILGCLVKNCGFCYVKCAACATCNCQSGIRHLWCKKFVGCCRG